MREKLLEVISQLMLKEWAVLRHQGDLVGIAINRLESVVSHVWNTLRYGTDECDAVGVPSRNLAQRMAEVGIVGNT